MVKRAEPSLLTWLSLRRTRSEPIRVKVPGSLRTGALGGLTLLASNSSSAKVALWPPPLTTLSLTVIWPAGTPNFLAPASTNIARAAAAAVRSWVQLLEMAVLPPVP